MNCREKLVLSLENSPLIRGGKGECKPLLEGSAEAKRRRGVLSGTQPRPLPMPEKHRHKEERFYAVGGSLNPFPEKIGTKCGLRGDRQRSVQRSRQGCVDGLLNWLRTLLKHSAPTEHTPRSLPMLSIVLVMIFTILGSLTATLQAQSSEPISAHYPQLEEYLRIATEENPELRALWHQYRADLEVIPQVGTLPNPEINIGYTLNPMMSESVLGQFSASTMQMFPWFGTLQTRRELQRASAEAGYERLNTRQLALFRNIQTTWFDLAELNQKIAIAQETVELMRDLEALVEVRYETGRAGQADLLRIQMEEQRLHTLIENLQDKVNPIQTQFNAYLNRDSDTKVETTDRIEQRDFILNEDQLRAQIQELNPEFSELNAREQMLNNQQDLARMNGRPSFGLGIEVMGRNFGPMSMFPDSKEMFAAMATIRVPLWRSRYSAQNRQASEQLRSVDYSRIQTGNRLNTELEQALERYRESERNITLLTEELLPRAEQALSILSEEYAAGNTRFDEVLQVQRQLLDLELEQIEAIVKQYIAIINIEALVGDVGSYQGGDEYLNEKYK